MKTKGYVQDAVDRGKLVRDKVANVFWLANLNSISLSDIDANLVVKSLRDGNALSYEAKVKAEALVQRIDREEAIRRLHATIEHLEAKRPMAILDGVIDGIKAKLDEWFGKAKADPYYSFAWGNDAVKMAAKLKVYGRIRLMFQDYETIEAWKDIMDEVTNEALRLAASPPRSTSPMSNVVETYETEVLAEVARGQDFNLREISFWFAQKAEVERVVSELNLSI